MSRFSTAGRQRRLNVELFLAISARELFFWLNGTYRYAPVRVDGWRGLEEGGGCGGRGADTCDDTRDFFTNYFGGSELEQGRTASVAVIHSRDGGEFAGARRAR